MFTTISNAITGVFQDFTTPFLYFIRISSICGKFLVDTIVFILYFIFQTLLSIKEFCVVFWDDYTFFASELFQSGHNICSILFEAPHIVGNKLFVFFQDINLFVITVVQQIYAALEVTLNFGAYLPSRVWILFKMVCSGFSFIGSCIIAAMVTTPKTIIEWIADIPDNFLNWISDLRHNFISTLCKMDFIINFDGSEFLACILGLFVILISVVYYAEIINSFIVIIRSIYTTIIDIVNQYWTGEFLENPNRNIPVCEQPIQRDGIDEPTLCIVCWSAPKNILYMPCRHCCICKNCSDIMKASTCLLCRKKIRNTIQIYT